MKKVTADTWAKAVKHAISQEDMYARVDGIDELEPSCQPDDDDDELIEQANELSIEEPVVFKCENCDFESHNPGAFKAHTNSLKKCESCPKLFCGNRSVQNLKSHQREHDFKPKKAHICVHCHKAYQYASKLKHHMKWSPCGRKALEDSEVFVQHALDNHELSNDHEMEDSQESEKIVTSSKRKRKQIIHTREEF